jgi:hexosaminidase
MKTPRSQVHIEIHFPLTNLNLDIQESYSIDSNGASIRIKAGTVFGARHALETLSQLITFDEERKVFQMPQEIQIEDSPSFK